MQLKQTHTLVMMPVSEYIEENISRKIYQHMPISGGVPKKHSRNFRFYQLFISFLEGCLCVT